MGRRRFRRAEAAPGGPRRRGFGPKPRRPKFGAQGGPPPPRCFPESLGEKKPGKSLSQNPTVKTDMFNICKTY